MRCIPFPGYDYAHVVRMYFAGIREPESRDRVHFPVHTSATPGIAAVPDVTGASLAVDAFLHKSQEPPTSQSDQSGRYDPDGAQRGHGVFHAHAHDMTFLAQWMGEMLDLNKQCGINGKRDYGPSRKP